MIPPENDFQSVGTKALITPFPGSLPLSVSALDPRARDIYYRVRDFIRGEILPVEADFAEYVSDPSKRWTVNPKMEELKVGFCDFRVKTVMAHYDKDRKKDNSFMM